LGSYSGERKSTHQEELVKLKLMFVVAGLALFAISVSTASAGNGDKVTGGGQILVGDNAGTTIAFTAQGTTSSAKGQLTIIDRGTFNTESGKGQAQEKFKGIVDCVETGQLDPEDSDSAGFGVVSGYERGHTDNRFLLRVIDNGQGGNADGNDMIDFEEGVTDDGDTCKPDKNGDEVEDDPDLRFDLGRGNAKVRDGAGDTNDPEPPEQTEETSASALSFLAL
jgi:hypothetical protein